MSKTIRGVVADGYLVGATVFSDQNGNKQWDEGEPKAITGAGGTYVLEGSDVDLYPVVALVTVDTVDEDTNAPVAKKYILAAPAGKPDFVSPMTTLVQKQLESNPSLSPDDAEQAVKQQVGATDQVSLFEDYVAGRSTTVEYDNLHKIAQVVASIFGEMQEQVESAAQTAGYTPDEVLDALVDMVTRRVMEQLSAIAVAVDQAGDTADTSSIADDMVTAINDDAPVSSGTIEQEIEQAQTTATVSSLQKVLQDGGMHWFWSEESFDGSTTQYDLEYGVVTLDSDGRTLHDTDYQYDFVGSQWSPYTEDSNYFLVGGTWTQASDTAEGGTVTFNADGTVTVTNSESGQEQDMSVAEYDLGGKPMDAFVDPTLAKFLHDSAAIFPAGAKAYKDTARTRAVSYQLWDEDGGAFDSLVTTYAKGLGNYLYWSGLLLQLGSDHTADVFLDSTGTVQWTGTWEDKTVQGQTIRFLHLPNAAILASDEDGGEPIFVKWADGNTWKGVYSAAGSIAVDKDFTFNKTAFDAIKGNLDLAGSSDGGTSQLPALDAAALIGTWAEANDPDLGQGTWHFFGNGSYTMEWPSYSDDATGSIVNTPIVFSGTYAVEGNTVTLSPESAADTQGNPITDYDTCWFFTPYYSSLILTNVNLTSTSPAELHLAPGWSAVETPAQPASCGNDGGPMDTSVDMLLITQTSTTP